jgi:hypothetical protein
MTNISEKGIVMEKEELLFVVSNGLNEKQSEFVDKFADSYGFKKEYVVFEANDLQSEVNAYLLTAEKAADYVKKQKKKPYFIFAVEHGTYFITRTIEDFGVEQIIHIDHNGVRFGY